MLALPTADVQRLEWNERAMIRWTGKVNINDKISSDSLLNKLCLIFISYRDVMLKRNEFSWIFLM